MNFRQRGTLESVCSIIADCPHSTPCWTESGYLVIRNQNIKNGKLDLSERSYTDHKHYLIRIRRAKPQSGDLIFTREAPMGDVCMVPEGLECCVGQRQVLLRPDTKKVVPRFLLYAIQSPEVQHEISWSEGTGSTVSNVRIPVLKNIKIPLFPLKEQAEIATMLGALDDRIALLRETNATLEAIAQALFKSWFVDFDPVRAKLEGRAPDGMDEATASLFPDGLEESEFGLVPRGWKASQLSDVLKAKNERVGQLSIPEYASTNEGLVPRANLYKKQLAASSSNNKLIHYGDIVFGLSRQVLNFGQMFEEIGSVSSAYKVYRIDPQKILPEFLGRLIRTRSDYFFNAVSSSSREGQSISTDALGLLAFVCPPVAIQQKLWAYIQPLLSRSINCLQQANQLCEIRDVLLPRLISGQLRLPEAETAVAAVL